MANAAQTPAADRGGGQITRTRSAGTDHQVVTVEGRSSAYRRTPCAECPWRLDAPIGAFPAEAYRHSAETAYDAALTKFSCHMSGLEKPQTCAGFLLRNSDNNIGVRISAMMGDLDMNKITAEGVELYDSYKEMAVANGVSPDDPALTRCRANGEF